MHRLHRRWLGDTKRLARFIRRNGIKAVRLAETAGVSRQHVARLQAARADPTRAMMVWLTIAARRLLGRQVAVTELFDLGDDEPVEKGVMDAG
jgi:predicted transcriptional regulator